MYIKEANPNELANRIKLMAKKINVLTLKVKELENIISGYDQTIIKRIIDGKDEKIKDYQETRNKI
tara:strand:- start:2135 stop:2332 length:198 start_codon:yes stop_codon:yes gene_type:complete